MSSSIHVFLRVNEDTFAQVGCGSGSTKIYHYISSWAHYGCIKELSPNAIARIRERANDDLNDYKRIIEQYQNQIETIGTWNNSVDDKLEAIYDINRSIKELQQEIDEINAFFVQLNLFEDMIDMDYYDEDKPMRELWVGIDCGSLVSVSDMETPR